jgi:hypothetical protein
MGRAAGQPDDAEHQEHAEKEKSDRRDEACPLPVDVSPRQLTWLPGKQRKRSKDLSLEMKDPVREIVEEGFKGAMDVRVLPALAAIRAVKRCAAVEAVRFMRMPIAFAGRGFDRAADYSPGESIAKCFKVSHLKTPLARH